MKRVTTLFIAVLLCAVCAVAQDEPTVIAETMYLLPKRGMNEKFEAAVKAHNDKFHKEGPHYAALRTVEYGEKAGWYVWLMRGTYASLDSRPAEGDHDDDWSKTIDPLVEEYGKTDIWAYNKDLSFGMDIFEKAKYYNVWAVDLKRGQYDRFKALISRVKKAFEAKGDRAFLVYNNTIHSPGGADVALIWSFESYEDLGSDWGQRKAYEEIFGEGSWDGMVAEWQSMIVDYNEEYRKK